MIDTVRGVIRVRKWPKKRGTPKSPKQRFWNDWFSQANKLAKYADPMSQVRAIEMTKGTGQYPRDVLLMAMRGSLYYWADATGWKWFSVASIQGLSDSLDILAQTVGSVLVRATDRWRTPTPGILNDLLTLKGSPLVPVWASPAGGGVAFGGCLLGKSAGQTINNATFTVLTWDTEVYDTDDLHDNVTNNSRITIPAGWLKCRLSAGVRWTSNNVNDRIVHFKKNGSTFPGMAQHNRPAANNSEDSIVSAPIDCVAGDYFECQVWQDRGAGLNIIGPHNNIYFAIERLK